MEHKELIIRSFRKCGITIALDGSEDSDINIRGLENYVVDRVEEQDLKVKKNILARVILEVMRKRVNLFGTDFGSQCTCGFFLYWNSIGRGNISTYYCSE